MRKQAILCVITLLVCSAHSAVAEVGFAQFNIQSERGEPIPISLWYPTDERPTQIVRGPFIFQATENAVPRPEQHPLVVISHGSASGSLTHVNLAVHLTQAGYVVAAPNHWQDNFQDESGAGTARVIQARAADVSAAIDRIFGPNPLGLMVDQDRVAVLGFSAGGATALALGGAKPAMAAAIQHCAAYVDPFCGFVDPKDPRFDDATLMLGLDDGRIQSLVLMAPVTAYFSDAELAMLDMPIFVFAPGNDAALSAEANAGRLQTLIQDDLRYYEDPAAGHFSILPVFSTAVSNDVPLVLRTDPAGFDRASFHQRLFGKVVTFLDETLPGVD